MKKKYTHDNNLANLGFKTYLYILFLIPSTVLGFYCSLLGTNVSRTENVGKSKLSVVTGQ